jgi:hypothetical protein
MSLTPPVIAGIVIVVIVAGCLLSAAVWPQRALLSPFRRRFGTAPRWRGRGTNVVDQPEFKRPTNEGDLL